jgi:hypothetical protein
MGWEDVVAVGLGLPGVEVSTAYGAPALKVRGKFLTRLRPEDQSVVFLEVGFDERELLLEMDPETFHLTDHYRPYPAILARVAQLQPDEARRFLERRWRKVAPKSLIKAFDAAAAGTTA